jgi:hypothetical protein
MRASGRICVALDSLNADWPEHWWCNPPIDLKLPSSQWRAVSRPLGVQA